MYIYIHTHAHAGHIQCIYLYHMFPHIYIDIIHINASIREDSQRPGP